MGHVLSETIVFADGTRKGPLLGSPPAYASAVSARLGFHSGIVTKLGPDAPAGLLSPLLEAGVDLEGVDRSSPVTTTNELIYAADGAKELRYLRQAAEIVFEDIPERYLTASVFHVGTLDYEVSPATVSRIAALGPILAVDLGGYGGAHVRRDTAARKRLSAAELRQLVACSTVVKASDEDARLLFSSEHLSETQVARRFVDWGADVGLLTLGARGSIVASGRDIVQVPALPGEVADVTGGGDCYLSGFLVEYRRTGDPLQSARFATAVARWVIGRTGGVLAERMPRDVQVRELMREAMAQVSR